MDERVAAILKGLNRNRVIGPGYVRSEPSKVMMPLIANVANQIAKTLRDLSRTANARIYIGFDKHLASNPTGKIEE